MAGDGWECYRRHSGDTLATWPTFVRVCRIFRGVRLSLLLLLLQPGFPIPCTYTVSRKMSLYAESHMAFPPFSLFPHHQTGRQSMEQEKEVGYSLPGHKDSGLYS